MFNRFRTMRLFLALSLYMDFSNWCYRSVFIGGHEFGNYELYGRRYDHYHGKYSDSELMVDVINNLGLNILMIHNEHNDNNIAFSPYGVGVVLIALGEGLRGEALFEMRKAVNLPYDGHTIRVGLRDIHRHLKSYFIPKEGFLAGITFNSENISINARYIQLLRFYGYDINSFNVAVYPESHVTTTQITMDGREATTVTVNDNLDTTTSSIQNGVQETTTHKENTEYTTEEIETTSKGIQSTSESPSTTVQQMTTFSPTTSSDITIVTTFQPTTNPYSEIINTSSIIPETANTEPAQTTTVEIRSTTIQTIEETPTEQESATVVSSSVETNMNDVEKVATTTIVSDVTISPSLDENPANTELVNPEELTTIDSLDDMESEAVGVFSNGNTSEIEVTINNVSFSIPSLPRNETTFNVNTRTTTDFPEVDSNATEIIVVRKARSLKDETSNSGSSFFDVIINKELILDSEQNSSYDSGSSEENDNYSNTTPFIEEFEINHHVEIVRETRSIKSTNFHADMNNDSLNHAEEYRRKYSDDHQKAKVVNSPGREILRNLDTSDDIRDFEVHIDNKILISESGEDSNSHIRNRTSEEFRKIRSVEEYILERQYEPHPHFRPPKPYLPNEPPYFLVDGKIRESNIDFVTYNAVLPYLYVGHLGAMALAFPLDSDKYYLLLVLPLKNDGLNELICNIRMHNTFKYIVNNLELTHVKATIPSFNLKGRIMLTNTIQKLGIRKIFEPRQADFTPMTNDENIYVTNLEQAVSVTIKNYVDLTNDGRYGNHYLHPEPVRFDVNHPFLYFVIDSELQVILMTGKVVNPLNIRIK